MKEMTYRCPDGVIRTWKEWADHLFSGEPWYDKLDAIDADDRMTADRIGALLASNSGTEAVQ